MRLAGPLIAAAAAFVPVGGAVLAAPVVLELYTSQGCSSCPPADALLTQLAGLDGVIALALHVDYWDYLGWKDDFARPQHTARQRAYAKAARSRSIFTPEMVVQGEDRLKGHDAQRVMEEIARQRALPAAADVNLARDGDALQVHVAPAGDDPVPGPADVYLVRFIPSEGVSIQGGENAGKEMTYTNIVTDWQTIGQWDGAGPLDLRYDDAGAGPLAVIVQRSHMGPVLTAAELQ
ncbi:MAG: DUF1223 domain-containing protein [Amaricoccus sp.]